MNPRRCVRCGHPTAIHEQSCNVGEPPETLFGFTVWAHMIPPFRPERSLILGDSDAIVGLIHKIWGSDLVIVTGKHATKFNSTFDFICIDLWDGKQPSKFIFRPEFVRWIVDLSPIIICANVPLRDMLNLQRNISDHGPFRFERGDPVGGNVVLWWSHKQVGI